MEAERKSAVKSNRKLKGDNEELMKKNEELESSQTAKLEEVMAGWVELAEKLAKQFDNMKKKMSQGRRDSDQLKLAEKEKEKLLNEKESIARRYEELLEDQRSSTATMEKINAKRQTAIDSMISTKAQLALSILENSNLSNELRRLKVENKERAENIADVKTQLDEANYELNTVTVEKNKAEIIAQELDVALEHYKDESERYKDQSEVYKKEMKEYKNALIDTESQLAESEASARKKDAIIADLRQKVPKNEYSPGPNFGQLTIKQESLDY